MSCNIVYWFYRKLAWKQRLILHHHLLTCENKLWMHLFAIVVRTTLTHVSQTVLSTVNGEVKGAQLDKICWYNPHPLQKKKICLIGHYQTLMCADKFFNICMSSVLTVLTFHPCLYWSSYMGLCPLICQENKFMGNKLLLVSWLFFCLSSRVKYKCCSVKLYILQSLYSVFYWNICALVCLSLATTPKTAWDS